MNPSLTQSCSFKSSGYLQGIPSIDIDSLIYNLSDHFSSLYTRPFCRFGVAKNPPAQLEKSCPNCHKTFEQLVAHLAVCYAGQINNSKVTVPESCLELLCLIITYGLSKLALTFLLFTSEFNHPFVLFPMDSSKVRWDQLKF